MGRPAGVKEAKPRNTAAKKQASELAAMGIDPVEFLLMLLIDQKSIYLDESSTAQQKAAAAAFGAQIAEKAAPYVRAKLANVQVQADVDVSGSVAVSVYLPDNSRDKHGTEAAAWPAGDVPS